MLEPPMPHMGKGVALVAQVTPCILRVYSYLSISDSRNEHSSFYATTSNAYHARN